MSLKAEVDTADVEINASSATVNQSDEIQGGVPVTPPLAGGSYQVNYIVYQPIQWLTLIVLNIDR